MMKWFVLSLMILSTACNRSGESGPGDSESGPPSHYTIQNNSVDMILHISVGSNSVSIDPGECAALKPEDFSNLHVEESNVKWGWYLLSLDMLSYENICVPAEDSVLSDPCPKKAGHYLYLGDDEPLIPLDLTSRQAKDCTHF